MSSAAFNVGSGWNDRRPSLGIDVLALLFALGLHMPLVFMKFDVHKKAVDRPGERLVSVDLLEPEKPKPIVEEAPPPPPAPKENTLMSKLKALVRKEPPPPPPPPKPAAAPEKLPEAPKPLALQPKMDLPKVAPTLETKSGFKTNVDPNLVKEQQQLANVPVPGIAPLSAKKLGVIDNRDAVKTSKGNFQIAQNDSLKSIGGGPTLANTGPAIAIHTGNKASTEHFSAPVTQMADKGRIGAVPTGGLNTGPQLGLRDSIIARDAAPARIGGRTGGVVGGIPGGTGSKKDAGRFQPTAIGAGSLATPGTSAPAAALSPTIPKKREKPSMFTITGELSDRKILKQVAPEYPAWAQEQGISASVVLEFTVDPSGNVKNGVVVRRTSGYPKLDETAIQALRQWKFVPLPDGTNRDEVGMITFNYSLN